MTSEPYAFEAGIIKLNQRDLERWKRAFPSISVEGELIALSDWAGRQGKKWFVSVANALAKREREARRPSKRVEMVDPLGNSIEVGR